MLRSIAAAHSWQAVVPYFLDCWPGYINTVGLVLCSALNCTCYFYSLIIFYLFCNISLVFIEKLAVGFETVPGLTEEKKEVFSLPPCSDMNSLLTFASSLPMPN